MPGLRFWRRRRPAVQPPLPVGSVVPGRPSPEWGAIEAGAPPEPVTWAEPGATVADVDREGGDRPAAEPAQEVDAGPEVDTPAVPAAPRVGLVFGDGTHVVLDPDDPKAARFAALAEELNR